MEHEKEITLACINADTIAKNDTILINTYPQRKWWQRLIDFLLLRHQKPVIEPFVVTGVSGVTVTVKRVDDE
jgi:hypothetical protein